MTPDTDTDFTAPAPVPPIPLPRITLPLTKQGAGAPPAPQVTPRLPQQSAPIAPPAPPAPRVPKSAPTPPPPPAAPARVAPMPPPAAPAVPVQPVPVAVDTEEGTHDSENSGTSSHGDGSGGAFYTRQLRHGRASIMSGHHHKHAHKDGRKPLKNGTAVGRYLIVSLMGEGGFGLTYRAICQTTSEQVVLKEHMPAGVAVRDADGLFVIAASPENEDYFTSTLNEFRDEITTLMGLEHPNIVRIMDSFEANGTAYYVMPLVQGTQMEIPKLAELDPGKRAREARRIKQQARSMLDALVYLDQNNVVHRDLKPENVLITPEGQPIILDFGSARQLRPGREYSNMYTPAFCSPEQCASDKDPQWGNLPMGPWTDMYSMAACFYYCITRMLPPKAETRIFSYPNDPYRPLAKRQDLQELYGPVFLDALDRALMLKPEDRWQHPEEWRNYLAEGVQTRKAFNFRSLIPYFTTILFAGSSVVLACLLADKERQLDNVSEASATFTKKVLTEFIPEAADAPGFATSQGGFCTYLEEYLEVLETYADSDNLEYKECAGLGFSSIGLYHLDKGELTLAITYFKRAEGVISQLSQMAPESYHYRYLLAKTQLLHATALSCQGKDPEAQALIAEATTTLRAVCAGRPQSPEYACGLARALLLDINILCKQGDIEAASTKVQELSAMLEQTRHVQGYLNHEETKLLVAETAHVRGLMALERGNPDEAERCFNEELALYTNFLRKQPFSLTYNKGRAIATYHLGLVYSARAALDPSKATEYNNTAAQHYRKHIELCAELQRLEPSRPSYIYEECTSTLALQQIMLTNGQSSMAVAYADKLMHKTGDLIRLAPDDVSYRCMRAQAYRASAAAHRSSKDLHLVENELSESRAIMDEALKLAPEHSLVLTTYVDVMEESADYALQCGDEETSLLWLGKALEKVLILKGKYPEDTTYSMLEQRLRKKIDTVPKKAPEAS